MTRWYLKYVTFDLDSMSALSDLLDNFARVIKSTSRSEITDADLRLKCLVTVK